MGNAAQVGTSGTDWDQLLVGNLSASADTNTISIGFTNIPYASYDLYVLGLQSYGQQAISAQQSIFDGIETFNWIAPRDFSSQSLITPGTAIGGRNYALFSGRSGDITLTTSGMISGQVGHSFSGIHIVDTTVAAVPEPPTFALLGIGTICLAVCCWRRRKPKPC